VSFLQLHENGERGCDKMRRPIPNEPLVAVSPVPEERRRAIKPLKPRRIGAASDGIVARLHSGKTVVVRPEKKPLGSISGLAPF
jgi:hypothetical protein